MRILLLTRSTSLCAAVKSSAARFGEELHECGSLNEARERVRLDHFLVVCEVGFDGMSGVELCRAVRSTDSTHAVRVLVTGTSFDARAAEELLNEGADDLLAWPADANALELRLVKARRALAVTAGGLAQGTWVPADRTSIAVSLFTAQFSVGEDGRVLDWNDACEAIFSFTAAEAVGSRLCRVLGRPGDRGVRDMVAGVWNGDRVAGLAWRLGRENGEHSDLVVSLQPVVEASGAVVGASFTALDITSLKHEGSRSRLFMEVVGKSSNGIVITGVDERILYVNPAYERMSGYDLAELYAKKPAALLQGPLTSAEGRRQFRDAIITRRQTTIELVNYHKSGRPYWVEIHLSPVFDTSGACTHFVAIEEDISDRKQSEDAMRESEERFRCAMNSMEEGILLVDTSGIITSCNESVIRILGSSYERLVGRRFPDPVWHMTAEDGTPFLSGAEPVYATLERAAVQRNVVVRLRQAGGGQLYISMNCVPLTRTGELEPYMAVVTLTDITERKRAEQQIQEQMQRINEAVAELELQKVELKAANEKLEALAQTDGLTGLFNHRVFQERLEHEFQRAVRYHTPLSVVMLDVDKFKSYNDTYGHPAGDVVLKMVARMLHEYARATDFVARYGGEEFVVILPNTDPEGATAMAERFRQRLEEAVWPRRPVTASFGVASLTLDTPDRTALVAAADAALYASKQTGRNRVTHYGALPAPDKVTPAA